MGEFAKYFSASEFVCKCSNDRCPGKSTVPSTDLLGGLDQLRELAESPIEIVSGIRCRAHNRQVGGAEDSRHLPIHADAADIVIQGKSVEEMVELALRIAVFRYGGIGIYDNRIHVDTRPYLARWPKGCWQSQTEFTTFAEQENFA